MNSPEPSSGDLVPPTRRRELARQQLDHYGELTDKTTRDEMVRNAYAAGITQAEIYRRSGVSLTTIRGILGGEQ